MEIQPIGKIFSDESGFGILIDEKFRQGLTGLEDFGYIQLLWWCDKCDNVGDRAVLIEYKPYTKGPDELGVFATRAPERPNPVAVSTAYVTYVNKDSGTVGLAYIDGFDGTPVLDIKPYTPSLDRVEEPITPDWCSHWPKSVEQSGDFDWESEFNF